MYFLHKILLCIYLSDYAFGKYTGPTNQAGLNLIKEFEGFYANFYKDPVGIRTIGYGHACHANPCTLPLRGKYSVPLSKGNAENLLQDDLKASFEPCVNSAITYSGLTGNQYSALVSFTFNLGCGSLKSSTLKTLLNQGNVVGASNEFGKWINAGGKPLPGLIRRRAAEKALFCSNGGCSGSGGSASTQCRGKSNTDSLRIRSQPNTSSSPVTSLSSGQQITIIGRSQGTNVNGNSNWFKLSNGYVSAYYIDIVSTNGESWCKK